MYTTTDRHTHVEASRLPPTSLIHNELLKTVFNFSAILKATQNFFFIISYPIPNAHKHPGFTVFQKSLKHTPTFLHSMSHSNSLLSPSAHFIDHVLQPLARSYPDYLHNSTSLLHALRHLSVPDEATLVTIDVQSLYPSIPQDECFAIVYDEMHTKSHLILYDPNLIIHLLHTNVNLNHFEFATSFFQQIKGTAAFSPTIAKILFGSNFTEFLANPIPETTPMPKIHRRHHHNLATFTLRSESFSYSA